MKNWIRLPKEKLIEKLWAAEPKVKSILQNSRQIEEARFILFDYLNRLERDLFNMRSDTYFFNLNIIEKRNAKECIRVLSNVMRTENEYRTGASPLSLLFDLAKDAPGARDQVNEAFLCEFIALFRGITGKAGKHITSREIFKMKDGREAAIIRSNQLDEHAALIRRFFRRYKTGYDRSLIRQRQELKKEILHYFGADESDWQDYLWHYRHIIKDIQTLGALVHLEDDEREGLATAVENHIPFEITPHYLSLFNKSGRTDFDRQVRAQVIPSPSYCRGVIESRTLGTDMDFMGEKSTSPIDGITRRYPEILILKPYNSCPQICVYCQRNWEIKGIDDTVQMSRQKIREALAWIREHESISEVLITGGDPLTLKNDYLDWLIGEVAAIRHVERIRIGTRIPVTVPFRINDGLLDVFRTDASGTSISQVARKDYDFHSLALYGTPPSEFLPGHNPAQVFDVARGLVSPVEIHVVDQSETTPERQHVASKMLIWTDGPFVSRSWHPERHSDLPTRFVRHTENGQFTFVLQR